MARRKFEEDVVEETTTETTETTETVEESPDYHEQFVGILVDMGLSAEQAEAVHSMAMDLINAGDGETTETTEEVTEEQKVEARRARRMGSKRRKYSRRRGFSDDRPTGRRHEMSQVERLERRMRRLARQNREMREELSRVGARPAARPLSNRPQTRAQEAPVAVKQLTKSTQSALDMINSYKR